MKLLKLMAATAALMAAVSIGLSIAALAEQRRGCIRPGQIRWHNGKACVIERVSVDPGNGFVIIDERLLELL